MPANAPKTEGAKPHRNKDGNLNRSTLRKSVRAVIAKTQGKFVLEDYSLDKLVKLIDTAGGQRAFARKHGIPRTTIQAQLSRLRKDKFLHKPAPKARRVGEGKGVRRFIVTAAQDGTLPHMPFLENLERYRDWLKRDGSTCELMISGFSYNKRLFEEQNKKKVVYHSALEPYLTNERVRIANKIDICGEMNTLPTAVSPLSGFETYTGERWGIFPHAKVQLQSVATMKHDPAKIIMTTGAVTKPNYVQKKAGIKASFHHTYGAVLVEVGEDDTFFCRHLLGDRDDGSFYDLDRFVQTTGVTEGHHLECLTPGDLHVFQIDPVASRVIFGIHPTEKKRPSGERVWEAANPVKAGVSMIDALRPMFLFAHDVLDFRVRNHHNLADPHDRFSLFVNGTESVSDEMREVAFFLTYLKKHRPWMNLVVVDSNHDQALVRWLKTVDYRQDPVNAEFFLESQREVYRQIRLGNKDFSIFAHALTNFYEKHDCAGVTFLREDQSYRVGGVEHSNHGHRGPNGSRGSARALSKIGPKVTNGHSHTACIIDGDWQAGTTSLLDMQYNKGPSSWSHTLVGQYQNGHRVMITIQNGMYRL